MLLFMNIAIFNIIFFYLWVIFMILTIFILIKWMKQIKNKNNEIKLLQQQYIAKIDNIRKNHSETLEKIRIDMLKKEEERNRQLMENEKDILLILNGVATLLDLYDKVEIKESKNIIKLLEKIDMKLNQLIN